MLKEILSVSGKFGLFKLISHGKNMYIVESLVDGKRIPVHTKDKIVSLDDIAVYTETKEIPLATVLNNIKIKESGASIDIQSNIQPTELRAYFESVLPYYDKDKVYPSDMKKIMSWYNILLKAGITDFEKTEETEETEEKNNLKAIKAKKTKVKK